VTAKKVRNTTNPRNRSTPRRQRELKKRLRSVNSQSLYRRASQLIVNNAVGYSQRASSTAIAVLRAVMLDYKAPAASRVRAAQAILDAALRTSGVEDIEARLTALERLDPQKAALRRLTPDELMELRGCTDAKVEGRALRPTEVEIAKKYEAIEQDVRASKLRRLGQLARRLPKPGAR
jgi:hypothetical protein